MADTDTSTATGNDVPLNPTIQVTTTDSITSNDVLNTVNDTDRIQPRQLVSGKSRGTQQLGGPNLYADSDNQQIVSQTDGIPQVMLGNQPTFGEGFYVTKPGIDVTSTTDPSQFIFNSNQDIFKIALTGTITISSVPLTKSSVGVYFASTNFNSITHNLGYIPAVLAYISSGGSYFLLPGVGYQTSAASGAYYGEERIYGVADTNVVSFYTQQLLWISQAGSITMPGNTYNIKYFLLAESAA